MCKKCGSGNETELYSEICVHVPEPEKLETPVLVFPRLRICLDCGTSTFAMPGTELQVVRRSIQLPKFGPHPATDESRAMKDSFQSW
jgi:hypothetical protein